MKLPRVPIQRLMWIVAMVKAVVSRTAITVVISPKLTFSSVRHVPVDMARLTVEMEIPKLLRQMPDVVDRKAFGVSAVHPSDFAGREPTTLSAKGFRSFIVKSNLVGGDSVISVP